ncbi:MAG TPA: hypothetical protein VEM38_12445 [Burkholderiales bacterium]|nr:hypothetical protein [Burkholderiales bacterium]
MIPRSALRRQQIKLDNALNAQPFRLRGDVIFLDRNSTGVIQVQLNNTSEDLFPMAAGDGIEALPFEDFFVTSAAQAGLVVNLWYGYSARFKTFLSSTDISDRPGRQLGIVRGVTDRNPTAKVFNSSTGSVAPHAGTIRWTYTVPASRKCLVEFIALLQVRITAAAPVGLWQNAIQYTPSGGGATTIWNLISIGNAINDKDHEDLGASMTLLAGDTLNQLDADASTGGTTQQVSGFKGTEYDA